MPRVGGDGEEGATEPANWSASIAVVGVAAAESAALSEAAAAAVAAVATL